MTRSPYLMHGLLRSQSSDITRADDAYFETFCFFIRNGLHLRYKTAIGEFYFGNLEQYIAEEVVKGGLEVDPVRLYVAVKTMSQISPAAADLLNLFHENGFNMSERVARQEDEKLAKQRHDKGGGDNNPKGINQFPPKEVTLYNIQGDHKGSKAPTGTSREAGLNKLRKYSQPCGRPDHVSDHKTVSRLRERVLNKTLPKKEQLSVNKALELAGLRTCKVTVQWSQDSSPEQIAARIIAKVDPAMLDAVIEALRQRK